MRVFLTGVGCVGKTTIGSKLAELLGIRFFDLDHEIEIFFGTSIERLQNRFLTMHSYRSEAAKALVHLLNRPDSRDSVIALPPSGLMGGYLRAIRKSTGITVVLNDEPENILERITFYDIDSRLIEGKQPTPKEKRLYLREIKKDITCFRKTYERADLQVDISGLDADQSARKVKETVEAVGSRTSIAHGASKKGRGNMAKLGTKKRPIVVRVQKEERGRYVAERCAEHGWQYIIGFKPDKPEDISDLEKALNPPMPIQSHKVGRNDPCPCGSGKKYKNCCGEVRYRSVSLELRFT